MTTKNPAHKHAMLARSKEQTFNLGIAHMRLFAQGNFMALANACVGNHDTGGALLVFMAGARSEALVDAAVQAGILERIKGGVGERVYMYLWAHMHEDFMWLAQRSEAWTKTLSDAMPWKIVLAKNFHNSAWDASLNTFLKVWGPSKMEKYPHALQYMTHPSERHVLAAACAKDVRYINPTQIDALRPGASEWFRVRKELGIQETHNQATQAFRQWWRMGAHAPSGSPLDSSVFEPS